MSQVARGVTADVSDLVTPMGVLGEDGKWYAMRGGAADGAVLSLPGGTRVSASMTISASGSSHTAGDAVGGLLTFANAVRVAGGMAMIVGVEVVTSKKSITPRFRIRLYNASDATISADDAAWKNKIADIGKRLRYIDLPALTTATDTTNTDQSSTQDSTVRSTIVAADGSTTIYGYIETLDTFVSDNDQSITVVIDVVYLS